MAGAAARINIAQHIYSRLVVALKFNMVVRQGVSKMLQSRHNSVKLFYPDMRGLQGLGKIPRDCRRGAARRVK